MSYKRQLLLNNSQKSILKRLLANPKFSAKEIAVEIGILRIKTETNVAIIKDLGLLSRIGSPKGSS